MKSVKIIFLLISILFSQSNAVIESGNKKIYPALSFTSGGSKASGGNLTITNIGVGGLTDSQKNMSGGNFIMSSGPLQATYTPETAKSNLSSAHCYPIPFKPSAGHTKIRFIGLTQTAKIIIYTLSGEIVKTIDKSDSNDYIDWDVKNEKGNNVFSGVYLYIIKNTFETKKGKLMIIR